MPVPRGAVAEAKALIRRLAPPIEQSDDRGQHRALVTRWESHEAAEGIAAFLEKRKPDWAV